MLTETSIVFRLVLISWFGFPKATCSFTVSPGNAIYLKLQFLLPSSDNFLVLHRCSVLIEIWETYQYYQWTSVHSSQLLASPSDVMHIAPLAARGRYKRQKQGPSPTTVWYIDTQINQSNSQLLPLLHIHICGLLGQAQDEVLLTAE
jgi:hypothetical protein